MAVNDHEFDWLGNVFVPAPPQIVVEHDPDAADAAARADGITFLGHGGSSPSRRRIRLYPRRIWHVMALIAITALACTWPEPSIVVAIMVLAGMVTLKVIFSKRGPRVAEWGVVLAIVGALVVLSQPAAFPGNRQTRWTVPRKGVTRPFPPRLRVSPNPVISSSSAPTAQLGR